LDKLVFVGTEREAAVFFGFEGDGSIYRWGTPLQPSSKRITYSIYRSPSCALPTHVVADHKHGRMPALESHFHDLHDYLQGNVGRGVVQSLSLCCNKEMLGFSNIIIS
jgi:hypothetical protein